MIQCFWVTKKVINKQTSFWGKKKKTLVVSSQLNHKAELREMKLLHGKWFSKIKSDTPKEFLYYVCNPYICVCKILPHMKSEQNSSGSGNRDE